MSNTVKTTKSDEMLKSLAAQFASQSMAIFLQQKQEAREEEIYHVELVDELKVRIEDLEQALAEKDEELGQMAIQDNKRAEAMRALVKERDEFKSWWSRQLDINSDLRKEIMTLQEKVTIDSVEEKEAVNG